MGFSYAFLVTEHEILIIYTYFTVLGRSVPQKLVMSIIRKPLGYKHDDLACSFILFVTYFTCHLSEIWGPKQK